LPFFFLMLPFSLIRVVNKIASSSLLNLLGLRFGRCRQCFRFDFFQKFVLDRVPPFLHHSFSDSVCAWISSSRFRKTCSLQFHLQTEILFDPNYWREHLLTSLEHEHWSGFFTTNLHNTSLSSSSISSLLSEIFAKGRRLRYRVATTCCMLALRFWSG